MSFTSFIKEKLFVSPTYSSLNNAAEYPPVPPFSLEALKKNPTANRCLNMIVDAASSIKYETKDGKITTPDSLLQAGTVEDLLNRRPNAQMDASFFWRLVIMDLITTGNAYILIRDKALFYVPSAGMKVHGSALTLVDHYEYKTDTKFKPSEIIHIKDNTSRSVLTGESRLLGLAEILDLHKKMKDFQRNFFKNNAMPGVVLVSPNTLTEKLKERKLEQWKQDFNPTSGARKPAFLDGGISIENLNTATFREMDFENSIQSLEKDLARSMGVPPLLLEGGNNANITPNHRLFYLETIMPICHKISEAVSLKFGYNIVPRTVGVPALQPDLRDLANYISTLKNAGVITANEGREDIGKPKSDDADADRLITPANVAGSASNPSTGGRPKEPAEGDK